MTKVTKPRQSIKHYCTECFKELSVPSRIEIVNLLSKEGALTVSEIVKKFKLRQPTISYHLSRLEEAGLVRASRRGRFVYYELISKCSHSNKDCEVLYK